MLAPRRRPRLQVVAPTEKARPRPSAVTTTRTKPAGVLPLVMAVTAPSTTTLTPADVPSTSGVVAATENVLQLVVALLKEERSGQERR